MCKTEERNQQELVKLITFAISLLTIVGGLYWVIGLLLHK